MSSTTEDFDGPTSPSVPLNFEGWSAKPKPLDAAKHGERAVFWDDFHGSPTVVGRKNFDLHEDGCVAYTKDPIPVGSAWRITLLETTERLQTGLIVGLTSALPKTVPPTLPLVKTKHDFNYEIRYEPAKSAADNPKQRAGTLARNLPLLWDSGISKTLCLLLTARGELHIYFDGKHIKKIESDLSVDGPLWGAVDVFGRCVRIKSEILSLEPETGSPPHSSDAALPPMKCFMEESVKVDVPPSEETVILAPRGLGIVVKVPPEALQQNGIPSTFAFTACSPESFDFPDGYKSLSPIYYIAANKPLEKEVELKIEHSADIETDEQAQEMIFCVAKPPEDGSQKVHFIPIPAGEFEADAEHGILATKYLGFINAGTKTAATSEIKHRYAVMCSYSNEDSGTQHVALSVSIANEVYMTNFRDAVQKTSMTHLSRVPVSFGASASACVLYPLNENGWDVVADTRYCDFLKQDIDFDGRDSLSKIDYPPCYIFTIEASKGAKSCFQTFNVSGLTKEVDFQIPLHPTRPTTASYQAVDRPNLQTLELLGDIRIIEESAPNFREIGCNLLNDRHGNRVEAIDMEKTRTADKMREIYRKWLREDPNHSWTTLCDCFRRCGLNTLAHRIEQHLRLPSPPTSPGPRFPMSNTPRSPIQWIGERFVSLFSSSS